MNVNRVTLSAFGTTGVLLAASLTMLAMVSALVTFNAWPTRDRGAEASDVAVQRAPPARVVRATRRDAGATNGAAAHGRRGSGGSSAAGSRFASGGPGGRRGGGPADPGSHLFPSVPPPVVGPQPPGEGDPRGKPVHKKDDPKPSGPVHQIACGAGSAIGGVNGDAGAAVGSACKPLPTSPGPTTAGSPPLVDGLQAGG